LITGINTAMQAPSFTFNAEGFGKALLRWRSRAGWSQETASQWGQQSSFRSITGGNWSRLENGIVRTPGLETFLVLELINHRAHIKNHQGITDSALYERVMALEPLLRDDGRPWDAIDFILLFMGRIDAPSWLMGPTGEEDAARMSDEAKQLFETTALSRAISPAIAWQEIEMHAKAELTEAQVKRLKTVVTGWGRWSGLELDDMKTDGVYKPMELLSRWANG